MYFGESHVSVDEKGRVAIPVNFRSLMKTQGHETWFVTRGFDNALFLFNVPKWEELIHAGKGSMLDPRLLDFRRLFVGSVAMGRLDGQGRLPVPALLREYADIGREAILLGVDDHLELWSVTGWKTFQERQAQEYKRMAAELFGRPADGGQTTNGGCAGC